MGCMTTLLAPQTSSPTYHAIMLLHSHRCVGRREGAACVPKHGINYHCLLLSSLAALRRRQWILRANGTLSRKGNSITQHKSIFWCCLHRIYIAECVTAQFRDARRFPPCRFRRCRISKQRRPTAAWRDRSVTRSHRSTCDVPPDGGALARRQRSGYSWCASTARGVVCQTLPVAWGSGTATRARDAAARARCTPAARARRPPTCDAPLQPLDRSTRPSPGH